MNTYKLKDLITIYNGTDYSHLTEGDIPLYGSGGLMSYVNDYLYDGESILLPRKGTLNNIMYVNGKIWTVDTMYFATTNTELVLPYYLYCYLSLLDLSHLDSGSALPSMTKASYNNIEVTLPNLKLQHKLIKSIYSINQKIELNNQINAELEAMAKTLYDYWFVQFDFPDENGKPYKSSGGKMVYNAELKREIPVGWEVKQLKYYLDCNLNKLGSNHKFKEINYLDTSSLTNNILGDTQFLIFGKDDVPSRANMIVKENNILYSTVRPNQLHYGLIKKPMNNMIASTGYAVLSCKENPIYSSLFYLQITDKANTKKLIRISESAKSTYPSISPDDILSLKITLPKNNDLIDNAVQILNPIYDKIALLQNENKELSKLRDWLLPMLMNGQVEVIC